MRAITWRYAIIALLSVSVVACSGGSSGGDADVSDDTADAVDVAPDLDVSDDGDADEGSDGDSDGGEVDAPVAAIDSAPPALDNQTEAEFAFSCDQGACSLECKLDDEDWEACTSPLTLSGLNDEEHTFSVRASSDAGGTGDVSSHTWVVDSERPIPRIDSEPSEVIGVRDATVEFSCVDETCEFFCNLNDEGEQPCDSPYQLTDLSQGDYTLLVRAEDEAGNTSGSLQVTWKVDFTTPNVVDFEGPGPYSNTQRPSFEFACSLPPCVFDCSLDGGSFAPCESGVRYESLDPGSHELKVIATNDADRESPVFTYVWEIDLTPPELTVDSAPLGFVSTRTPVAEFSCSETPCTFSCIVDGTPVQDCTSPLTMGPLDDGDHTLLLRATDGASNSSPQESFSWTQDTVAPTLTVTDRPEEFESDPGAGASFSCSEDPCDIYCALDGEPVSACTDGFEPGTALADGAHTLVVYAEDVAGNESAEATIDWTVDTQPPSASFTNTPGSITNSPNVSFSFDCSEDGCTFECSFENEQTVSCASPFTRNGIVDGVYTLTVTAIDRAGNRGGGSLQAVTQVEIDTEDPDLRLDPADDGYFTQDKGAFPALSCVGSDRGRCEFFCELNGGGVEPCDDVAEDIDQLDDGRRDLRVYAGDSAGNRSDWFDTYWFVDTTDPVLTLTDTPPALSNGTPESISFTCSDTYDCTTRCRLNSDAVVDCTSPFTFSAEQGFNDVIVFAEDQAGNRTSETYQFRHDSVVPTFTLAEPAPVFLGQMQSVDILSPSEPLTLCECQIDGGPFTECGSCSEVDLGAADVGEYDVVVRARDDAGNLSDEVATTAEVLEHDWAQVSVGDLHACAVRDNGDLTCWGDNGSGQNGDDAFCVSSVGLIDYTPNRIGPSGGWEKVSAGFRHTCAIRTNGDLYCWGSNNSGALGIGITTLPGSNCEGIPQLVDSSNNWTDVSVGRNFACAIRSDETLWCWGDNTYGQVGNGAGSGIENEPVQVGNGYEAVYASAFHVCAKQDGAPRVACWGRNDEGQADPDSSDSEITSPRVESFSATSAGVGRYHSCLLTTADELDCFGSDDDYQMPNTTLESRDWRAISGGDLHSCAIEDITARTLWCWGDASEGQLSQYQGTRVVPVEVQDSFFFNRTFNERWESVDAGWDTTCAISIEGRLYCWGANDTGQVTAEFGDESVKTVPVLRFP